MGTIVAAYARVSTERQAENQSIEQQLVALRAYAAAQGWALADEHIYRDNGWSGARLDRPALDRLRDAAGRALVIRSSSPVPTGWPAAMPTRSGCWRSSRGSAARSSSSTGRRATTRRTRCWCRSAAR